MDILIVVTWKSQPLILWLYSLNISKFFFSLMEFKITRFDCTFNVVQWINAIFIKDSDYIKSVLDHLKPILCTYSTFTVYKQYIYCIHTSEFLFYLHHADGMKDVLLFSDRGLIRNILGRGRVPPKDLVSLIRSTQPPESALISRNTLIYGYSFHIDLNQESKLISIRSGFKKWSY